MKRYDLTSIGSSVEIGRGGPVIENSNGDLLVDGKDVMSAVKNSLTYINLLSEPTDTNNQYKVSDLNNIRFEHNGTEWAPVNGRGKLAALALPIGISPTFTGTTNGTFVLGTASPFAIKGFLYVPANSISASHSAGFYYCEMSDTTNGVFYTNTYTPADGVTTTEPITKTPFAGAVPGGTGVMSEITYFTKTIPANTLGEYGSIETSISGSVSSSANGKSFRMRLNTTAVGVQSLTTAVHLNGRHIVKNTSTTTQRGTLLTNSTGSTIAYTGAEDTTTSCTYNATLQMTASTEIMVAVSCVMELVK